MQSTYTKTKILDKAFMPKLAQIQTDFALNISTRVQSNTAEAEQFLCAACDLALSGNSSYITAAEQLSQQLRAAFITEGTAAHFTPLYSGIEYQLIRLYQITGNDMHLSTARQLILKRGTIAEETAQQNSRAYHVSRVPVLKLTAPEGQSECAIKLFSAVVACYAADRDATFLAAAESFYNQVTAKLCDIRYFPLADFSVAECGNSDSQILNSYSQEAAHSLAKLSLELSRIDNRAFYHEVIERIVLNGSVPDVRPYIFVETEGVVEINQFISAEYATSSGLVKIECDFFKPTDSNGVKREIGEVKITAPEGQQIRLRVPSFNNGLMGFSGLENQNGYVQFSGSRTVGVRLLPRLTYVSEGELACKIAILYASRLLAAPKSLNANLRYLTPCLKGGGGDKAVQADFFKVPAYQTTFVKQKYTYILPRKKSAEIIMKLYASLTVQQQAESKIFFF